jgi:flavin-dependent dehydrogenase
MLEAVANKGFQKKFGAKFIMGDEICDFDFSVQYTKGWNWTWQVPRADFDKTLADEVERKGGKILYETAVTGIEFFKDGVVTQIESSSGKQKITSKFVIDGSGYGRVLPRMLNLDKPSMMPPRAAVFMHVADKKRPDNIDGNRIQIVVIEQDIWVWIIPFSNGNTSVGVVGNILDKFDKDTYRDFLKHVVDSNDVLSDRFGDAEFVLQPQAITAYAATVSRFYGPRFVLTGNSTEFLDPVFSSGVTFALESGMVAGKLVARELKSEIVDWEKEYVEHMKQGVNTFRSYVNGWYDGTLQQIFFAKDFKQEIKEQICSVLAGYVWDTTNPYVRKHDTALKALSKVIGYYQ